MEISSPSKHPFADLASGKRIVYMATRLYDYHDKLATLELEDAVLGGLEAAAGALGLKLDRHPTFMPFRDTVENIQRLAQTVPEKERAQAIYLDDLERLSRLFALVTFLNGLCKDDGICMELGYAFAKGVPTLVVVTDFISYSTISAPNIEFIIDPILTRMSGKLLRHTTLQQSAVPFPDDLNSKSMQRVIADFRERLGSANQELYSEVREHIQRLSLNPDAYIAPFPILEKDDPIGRAKIFVDFCGGLYEWSRDSSLWLSNKLESLGFGVSIGKRFDPQTYQSHEAAGNSISQTHEIGSRDIIAALSADILVLSGDGPEVDGGTAALQGAARALGKPIVLYYSGNLQTNARGRYPTPRNLMLLYSADSVVNKLEEIPEAVTRHLKERGSP